MPKLISHAADGGTAPGPDGPERARDRPSHHARPPRPTGLAEVAKPARPSRANEDPASGGSADTRRYDGLLYEAGRDGGSHDWYHPNPFGAGAGAPRAHGPGRAPSGPWPKDPWQPARQPWQGWEGDRDWAYEGRARGPWARYPEPARAEPWEGEPWRDRPDRRSATRPRAGGLDAASLVRLVVDALANGQREMLVARVGQLVPAPAMAELRAWRVSLRALLGAFTECFDLVDGPAGGSVRLQPGAEPKSRQPLAGLDPELAQVVEQVHMQLDRPRSLTDVGTTGFRPALQKHKLRLKVLLLLAPERIRMGPDELVERAGQPALEDRW